jgi:hypothetical protein
MHSLAQPSSLQQADPSRESARAGIPVPNEDSATELAALPRTETLMVTIALYLRKDANPATARRCRMIAGAAAGAAVLPLPVRLTAYGPPPADPETGTLPILSSGPFAHRLRPSTPGQRPVRGSGITRPRASS